jgi:hypothetical protein
MVTAILAYIYPLPQFWSHGFISAVNFITKQHKSHMNPGIQKSLLLLNQKESCRIWVLTAVVMKSTTF